MFSRVIQAELEHLMQKYAVITILGPRQSGKTTIAKMAYPDKDYFNLENPDVREFIAEDPKAFLANLDLQKGVILDEIQRLPELLSYIQVIVDENRIIGSFILTGSHQLHLNQAISQSLAGRTALLELLPLSINELKDNDLKYTADEYLVNGFFPAIYQHNLNPTTNSRNYIKTYVERDVRQIVNIKDLHSFQRFIKLCAGRVGSTINRESLSNEVGVSQNTIKNWLSILEASYLTFQLQPYFENFGKRIIKAPKLYFLDIGLISYLLGIESPKQMNYNKLRGNIFENLVILEILKYQYNQGKDANIYFFRDNHNVEVDIILQVHDKLIPVEIKSSSTFNSSFLKNIKYFQKLTKEKSPIGFLIYSGEQEQKVGNIQVINYKNIHKMMMLITQY
jgi:predicted AAA+ superfamily ATPase